MKKILLIVMLFCSISMIAQAKKVYCEIVGDGNFKGDKVKIEVVFDDSDNTVSQEQAKRIKDEKKQFKTMLEALNYLAKSGWELEQTYAIPETAGMNRGCVFNYVLSMKVSD